jgi:hypothetical protein
MTTTVEFEAHLVRLGSYTFMDMMPKEKEPENGSAGFLSLLHYVPVHSFAKISVAGDVFSLDWGIDPEWFTRNIEKSERPEIRYEKYDNGDMYLLTDETGALQRFVLKHAGEKGFFGDTDELNRLK